MTQPSFPRRAQSVLLAAVAGAAIGLLLGAAGEREPVGDMLAREARCQIAYTPDAGWGLARELCRAGVPGITGQR